jgi:hypothetical protein
MKTSTMTGGQLCQIYNIARQHGRTEEEIQFLIEGGYMADFFAGKWDKVNRIDLHILAGLLPTDEWMPKRRFKLKLGVGPKTPEEFRGALEEKGVYAEESALEYLGNPKAVISQVEEEVEIILIWPSELGFTEHASQQAIYRKAMNKFGLSLCTADVAPQLILQCMKDLPQKNLFIATNAIKSFVAGGSHRNLLCNMSLNRFQAIYQPTLPPSRYCMVFINPRKA